MERFYAAQRAGQFASTSQIRPAVHLQAFGDCLRRGEDVLYLCFTSGMSGTFQTACLCAEELSARVRTEFREAKIHVAPIGPGMLALIFWGSEQ